MQFDVAKASAARLLRTAAKKKAGTVMHFGNIKTNYIRKGTKQ